MLANTSEGVGEPTPFRFALVPTHSPEQLLENVRSSLARGLEEVTQCEAHEEVMSIAGGGPSLADTWKELQGNGSYVAAVNGSLAYLLDKNVIPELCGVCDPSEHMKDIVEAVDGVTYFIASHVHPSVFNKLIEQRCRVFLWHNHPMAGLDALLDEHYGERGWTQIPGGCTMGLRWINLGYHIGFRNFHLHGMDSSFRDKSSHAYPDHQDAKNWITFDGFPTRVNFIGQVVDFEGLLENGLSHDVEPVKYTMHGDGLLQWRYKKWLEKYPATDFKWPDADVHGRKFINAESRNIAKFMELTDRRGIAVQAGGCVGTYPAMLAYYFDEVHTFEPDELNHSYLVKNMEKGFDNVTAFNMALGSTSGFASTECHEPGHTGATFVKETNQGCRMTTIDALDLPGCDLIWLDIEGYEVEALKGGAETIGRYKPVLIIEDNGNERLHGLPAGAASEWLADNGYVLEARYGSDNLYKFAGDE